MTETAELAGFPGILQQTIDPQDLPESFEWRTNDGLLAVSLDRAEAELADLADDPKGAPLSLPNRPRADDVLVEIAAVRREEGELLVVLRERPGNSAAERTTART